MKRLLSLLAVLALAVGLAACGDDDDDDPTVSGDDAAESTATAADDGEDTSTTTSAEEPAAGEATVAVAESDLGEILVDGGGMTLYLFTQDPAGGDTACVDACADAWPALFADGEPVAGEGVDASLLGTASHPGGEQVTYNGHRLYFYAADTAPGDVNGQGVGDVWYVVSPSGDAIT